MLRLISHVNQVTHIEGVYELMRAWLRNDNIGVSLELDSIFQEYSAGGDAHVVAYSRSPAAFVVIHWWGPNA